MGLGRTARAGLASILTAVLIGFAATQAAAQAVQRQRLGDVEVALRVAVLEALPDLPPAPHGLAVWLADAESGRGIDGAQVWVDIAERGFAGERQALAAAEQGEGRYEGVHSMPGRVPYRLLVHARLPGAARTLEAVFEYRHHH